MSSLTVPSEFNYVGVFLTFSCSRGCPYCLAMRPVSTRPVAHWSGREWIAALNRLALPADLPITLQGGEPTGHRDFYEIVAGLRPDAHLDLLTNLEFDLEEFMRRIPPSRFRREAPYASIRVSYHPPQAEPDRLFDRVARLQAGGYAVGIWGILHPYHREEVETARRRAQDRGLDFRAKEFLGRIDGRLYGTYRYPEALAGSLHGVRCRGRELLVAPDGSVYRCHHDLYAGINPLGSLGDERLPLTFRFRDCAAAGECHPCDIKLKNDRFQRFGYCAVEIEPSTD